MSKQDHITREHFLEMQLKSANEGIKRLQDQELERTKEVIELREALQGATVIANHAGARIKELKSELQSTQQREQKLIGGLREIRQIANRVKYLDINMGQVHDIARHVLDELEVLVDE